MLIFFNNCCEWELPVCGFFQLYAAFFKVTAVAWSLQSRPRTYPSSFYSETAMMTFAKLETQKLLQAYVDADERLIRFQQAQRRWNNIVYTVWIAIIATTATTMYFTQHEWLPVLRNVLRAIS
jgi:hypothetical protein